MAQMNHLEYIEYICKQYINEAMAVECVNKAKIKRLGIELRQATLEFERKNLIQETWMEKMKIEIKQGDCLELMKDIPDGSVDMILANLSKRLTEGR